MGERCPTCHGLTVVDRCRLLTDDGSPCARRKWGEPCPADRRPNECIIRVAAEDPRIAKVRAWAEEHRRWPDPEPTSAGVRHAARMVLYILEDGHE